VSTFHGTALSLATSFLLFTLALAGTVAYLIFRYFARTTKAEALVAFGAWLLYAGSIGYFGPYTKPPGIVFFLIPLVAWIVLLTRSRIGPVIYEAVPLAVLTGLQGFRLFVELYLNELWKIGLIPKMMTFHGANFDLVIAISAPVVALLIAKRSISWKAVLAWNVLGLAALANVVIRGVLSAPGPLQLLHDDFPNHAVGLFPFTFIPGLMVMLAVTLHIASIRRLLGAGATP
jgi:hypothetical protein